MWWTADHPHVCTDGVGFPNQWLFVVFLVTPCSLTSGDLGGSIGPVRSTPTRSSCTTSSFSASKPRTRPFHTAFFLFLLVLDFGMDKGKSAAKITASLEKLHLDSRPKILLSSSHSISFSLNKKEIETFPFSFIKWIYAKTCAFLFLTELILPFFWFVDFLVFWLIICRAPLFIVQGLMDRDHSSKTYF